MTKQQTPAKPPVKIQDKEVFSVQKVEEDGGKHIHLNAFDENESVIETFTYTSPEAAEAQAVALGATNDGNKSAFDNEGWWRLKS